jgi:hypothetical protein
LFSASGLHFIVFYFEYGRYGSGVLDWANSILATNQHRRLIVVTHHAGSAATPSNLSAQGQALYDGLKANTNFFIMLGGHVTGEGSRQNTFNGNTVRTFISAAFDRCSVWSCDTFSGTRQRCRFVARSSRRSREYAPWRWCMNRN